MVIMLSPVSISSADAADNDDDGAGNCGCGYDCGCSCSCRVNSERDCNCVHACEWRCEWRCDWSDEPFECDNNDHNVENHLKVGTPVGDVQPRSPTSFKDGTLAIHAVGVEIISISSKRIDHLHSTTASIPVSATPAPACLDQGYQQLHLHR